MDDAALFGQHDKNAHLFQSAEECTDKMYRPPELSIIIAIPPTNTSDDSFPYCNQRGMADIAWFPS